MKAGKRKQQAGGRILPIDHAPFFREAEGFVDEWSDYGLSDEDLRALQMTLAQSPFVGDVIVGTNGLRKVRYSAIKSNRGKSGSFRVFYAPLVEYNAIVLVLTLSKGDDDNLTKAHRNNLAKWVVAIKDSIKKEGTS